MADKSFLGWPFFERPPSRAGRRRSSDGARPICRSIMATSMPPAASWCAKLGRDGWLAHTAPDPDAPAALDVRTLCLDPRDAGAP